MRLSVLILTVAATFTPIVHSNEIDNCYDIYKKCNKQSLDDIWQLWEAGPKTNKAEDVDKIFYSSYEAHYKLLSCNELENACKQDRPANLDRYAFVKDNNLELDWVSTSAESKNVNQNKLDQAISSAKAIPRMQSFLVAKENELIVEEYFHRKGDYRPQHVQSVTKSITSLLIGIAIDQGYIKSEDDSIKDYFPEYFAKPHDKRKADITIKQLLAMQSGLNFSDNKDWSAYKDTESWSLLSDFKKYWYVDDHSSNALNYAMVESVHKPIMLYSTPACNLLTTTLSRASGMTAKQFADKYLFGPLGIENYFWYKDVAGNYIGGHTIFLRPRAVARLGQMLVDNGAYQGKQIVSKQWLDKSFQTVYEDYVHMTAVNEKLDYGLLWYMGEYLGFKYQLGWGFGGQFLFMVPSEKLVIVTTANPDVDGKVHWDKSQKIFKDVILKVIEAL